MTPIEGGCLCGACRYRADAAPINLRVCHCRLCQRAIGAAFNARVLVPLASVTLTGPVGRYNSSADLLRAFCTRCGTTLMSQRASNGVAGLTCGSLDRPEDFQPTEHFWTMSRQPWLRIDDGLPDHPEAAPP